MRRRGFTLVELMIVMVIIGILITFILRATMAGIRRAEEKATISLVAKLEQAMSDRVDALATYQADPSPAHYELAALYNSKSLDPSGANIVPIPSVQRAQAIAQYDYMRSQLPDVFVVQSTAAGAANVYPLNFAGDQYRGLYSVPIGADNGNYGPVTGMYGATFEAAAGLYKQLGYGPKGYDGNDNNFDGFIDDRLEGEMGLSAEEIATITLRLQRHTHKTARAEVLYAILVEGFGPYGSVFDRDDFTSKEVMDTDGDGLMEFVDAWGEPLQFYRWPVLYRSDTQKGFPDVAKLTQDLGAGLPPGPYSSAFETREQNPIDPNQTLLSPAWWGNSFNDTPIPSVFNAANAPLSGAAMTFMRLFGPLVDPIAVSRNDASNATFWDRSTSKATGYFIRRAYYSRFLILSGGPDKSPGTAQLGVNYRGIDDRSTVDIPGGTVTTRDTSGSLVPVVVTSDLPATVRGLLLESQGGKVDLNRNSLLGDLSVMTAAGRNDTNSQLEYYGQDDITSQALQTTGGALQ